MTSLPPLAPPRTSGHEGSALRRTMMTTGAQGASAPASSTQAADKAAVVAAAAAMAGGEGAAGSSSASGSGGVSFTPGTRFGRSHTLVLSHGSLKRSTLSARAKFTLGQGNLRQAVCLPPNEDLNEWLAANLVDFFNEISLLYSICTDDAKRFTGPGEGFPPGFQYLWADGTKVVAPMKCSSPEYVAFVMSWVEEQINDEKIFPSNGANFAEDFLEVHALNIFKRLFRIFAIMYHSHFAAMEKVSAVNHLNTCMKHFMFFCLEFDLLDENETKALQGPVDRLTEDFDRQPLPSISRGADAQ